MKLIAPEPCPICVNVSALSAPAFRLGITKPRPMRPITIHPAITQNEVSASAPDSRRDDNANTIRPKVMVRCAGVRSVRRPAIGNTTASTRPAGIRISPACVGE